MMEKKPKRRRRWDAVADRVPEGAVGAEVGVYIGAMSRELFRCIKGLRLFMIDRWQPYSKEEKTRSPSFTANIRDVSRWESIKKSAMDVAQANKGAVVLCEDSVEAASHVADGALDFVFIDGDHSYEGVVRDIKVWKPKVKLGGWVMGHDYGNKPDGGVKRAVDELGLPVELDSDHVWAVRL